MDRSTHKSPIDDHDHDHERAQLVPDISENDLNRVRAILRAQFEAELKAKEKERENIDTTLDLCDQMMSQIKKLLRTRLVDEQKDILENRKNEKERERREKEEEEEKEKEKEEGTKTGSSPNDVGIGEKESRFYVQKRVVVGNTSKMIERTGSNGQNVFKWLVYVKGSDKHPDISSFVSKVRFFLHSTYKPHDVVEVTAPPFQILRRGWGEFPIRVQLHFTDPQNRPVDIHHQIQLDRDRLGGERVYIADETTVDIELNKDWFEKRRGRGTSPDDDGDQQRGQPHSQSQSQLTETEEAQAHAHVQPQSVPGTSTTSHSTLADQSKLHEAASKFPIISTSGGLPFSTAPSIAAWKRWGIARRRSTEWQCARNVRFSAGINLNSWSTRIVLQWMRAEGYIPPGPQIEHIRNDYSLSDGKGVVGMCKYCGSVHTLSTDWRNQQQLESQCGLASGVYEDGEILTVPTPLSKQLGAALVVKIKKRPPVEWDGDVRIDDDETEKGKGKKRERDKEDRDGADTPTCVESQMSMDMDIKIQTEDTPWMAREVSRILPWPKRLKVKNGGVTSVSDGAMSAIQVAASSFVKDMLKFGVMVIKEKSKTASKDPLPAPHVFVPLHVYSVATRVPAFDFLSVAGMKRSVGGGGKKAKK